MRHGSSGWLREPLAHFLLIGLALFLLNAALNHGGGRNGAAYRIALTDDDVRQLRTTFAAQWQRAPSPAEMRGLAENKIREEVLYCEALRLALILFPLPSEAHLNSTGMGPVYDGVLHFVLSPEDLLAVLALALFAGQRGAAHGRWTLFILPGAWLAGGLLGLTTAAVDGTALTFLSFLLLGGLLALDARLSLSATTVLAALVGLFHGYLNGAGMGRLADGAVALLGLAFAVFVLVALASSFALPLQQQWLKIGVRVIGSWIVASGLLMMGWALRRG